MEKSFAGVVGVFFIVFGVFFIVCLGTLMGALAGWIVGLFFSDTILGTLARFGVDTNGMLMWQLGATLAFVGSFFKAMSVSKK